MRLPTKEFAVLLACAGVGSSLQADIPADLPVASLISSAKSHLATGSPRDALAYFDAAVARDPTNYLTIFQRGATYLSLGRDTQAIDDFNRVLKLKPDFDGALLQRSRIKSRSADWTGAKEDLVKAGKKSSPEYVELDEAQTAEKAAEQAEAKGDWETTHTTNFPGSVEPHLQISSTLFYSLGDYERAIAQIRKCLHSDPDSKSCSRLFRKEKQYVKSLNKLQEFKEKRKFTNAINILVGTKDESGMIDDVKEDVKEAREAGYIHPNAPNELYASLIEVTCEIYRAMNSKKAKTYCADILQLKPHSLHGLLYQAQTYIDEDEFERAINTLTTAKEHHQSSREVQELLQKAQVLLKRSKQKDYYKILGVSRDADDRTIKRAYRQLTKIHHPDKAMSQGVSKEDAETKMASINEAYEVLSDPELRARFDNGDDPNDPESGRGGPFQGHPFAGGRGGGGQQFFFQQGGGGGGAQFKFNGFPGGFPF
uniref:DnaJ like subfamily C member 3 n=1 Tax=Talaromyces marneffei PM1 TaxID=1077442 RepID=A0A093V579_TALMA